MEVIISSFDSLRTFSFIFCKKINNSKKQKQKQKDINKNKYNDSTNYLMFAQIKIFMLQLNQI